MKVKIQIIIVLFVIALISCKEKSAIPKSATTMSLISKVGPFEKGGTDLSIWNSLTVYQLADSIGTNNYTEIHIFSSVDNQELKRSALKSYKENFNLAQARGERVKELILPILEKSNIPVFIYPQGATYFGNDSVKLSDDRVVQVWGKR